MGSVGGMDNGSKFRAVGALGGSSEVGADVPSACEGKEDGLSRSGKDSRGWLDGGTVSVREQGRRVLRTFEGALGVVRVAGSVGLVVVGVVVGKLLLEFIVEELELVVVVVRVV